MMADWQADWQAAGQAGSLPWQKGRYPWFFIATLHTGANSFSTGFPFPERPVLPSYWCREGTLDNQ